MSSEAAELLILPLQVAALGAAWLAVAARVAWGATRSALGVFLAGTSVDTPSISCTHALITGASSGLGAELAVQLARTRPGVRLTLCGRNRARLAEVRAACEQNGAEVNEYCGSVAEGKFAAFVTALDRRDPVDLVVASAGVSRNGVQSESYAQRAQTIIDTSIQGTLSAILPVLEGMRARKSGRIVLLSSLAGFACLPNTPAYGAAKAFLRLFGLTLAPLVAGEGVSVTVVCPGYVDTPHVQKNTFRMPFLVKTKDAVNAIIRGAEDRKPLVAFPFPMYAIVRILSILPPTLVVAIVQWMKRRGVDWARVG